MQQLYFTMNHDTVSPGTITYTLGLPPYIENHDYTERPFSGMPSAQEQTQARILDITLSLTNTQTSVTTSITLGSNVVWNNSTFLSNSTNAVIIANKFWNGTGFLSVYSLETR